MHVLILSCNTGEGHNSCGKAIQQEFEAQGIPCMMDDAFRFISTGVSNFLSSGFTGVYRHAPGLFRNGYQYAEKHPALFKEDSRIYKMITAGTETLYEYVTAEEYDVIVCTHVFSALIVTEMQARYRTAFRTCFVATDYTCSPSCAESNMDIYFIPDQRLREDFVRCGVPREKIVASGIPLRKELYHSIGKAEAKKKLGLKPDDRHLVIMCGSMGCGPIKEIAKCLVGKLPPKYCASIVCGTNGRLRQTLERILAKERQIGVYGYVTDISAMLDSADLFLTKPGGISVTEAACKRIPMVFVNAVAGCEAYNMRFFMEQKTAVTADTPEALVELSLSTLKNSAALERMSLAYAPTAKHTPTENIVRTVVDLRSP